MRHCRKCHSPMDDLRFNECISCWNEGYDSDDDQPDFIDEYEEYYYDDDGLSDMEADSMTLRDAGMGTDEDYGYYGDEYDDWG